LLFTRKKARTMKQAQLRNV